MNSINQELINRYEELQNIVKQADKELARLKADFIASNGGESETHLVVIRDNFREILVSKDVFATKFGEDFLKENELTKISAFNTIVIARKAV